MFTVLFWLHKVNTKQKLCAYHHNNRSCILLFPSTYRFRICLGSSVGCFFFQTWIQGTGFPFSHNLLLQKKPSDWVYLHKHIMKELWQQSGRGREAFPEKESSVSTIKHKNTTTICHESEILNHIWIWSTTLPQMQWHTTNRVQDQEDICTALFSNNSPNRQNFQVRMLSRKGEHGKLGKREEDKKDLSLW